MSERVKNVTLMMVTLFLGLILYILFRPQTYIAKLTAIVLPVGELQALVDDWKCSFLRYYFPDFLWSFSLTCGLMAIFCSSKTMKVWCCVVSVFVGVVWECFQNLGIISGTGDILDVFMYLSGACLCMLINLRRIGMKKISLILAVLLLCAFFVFALGSGESETYDQGEGKADKQETAADELGDYTVTIDSCRLAKDYAGKDVVIIKYTFTNVSNDDATAFYIAFNEGVYQNGVGLNEAYVLDDSADYSADNQTKEIKKGASIEVEVAYELDDTTTDIEVEVKELFSFSDKTITKTFKISE